MSKYKHGPEESYDKCAETTAKMIPLNIKGKLLDIGCYKGYLRKYLPSTIEYVGLDLDKWFPEVAQCDLNNCKLPFKNNEFDIVVCANVLEHLFYPDKICEEMRRILKKRGVAIISLPNDKGLGKLYSTIFEEPQEFESQKYNHHWLFSRRTARPFISKYFDIIEEKMYNGQILDKLDFILKHFPSLCSNIYYKVKK